MPSNALVPTAGRIRRLVALAEAHPLAAVAVVAIGARLAFALASFLLNGGVLIPDEQQYVDLASYVSDGRGAEAWFPGYGNDLFRSTWTFTAPLTLLFAVLWPTRLLGQLLAAGFGVATAVLTTRLVLEVARRRTALLAGLVVAALPSQVLWSSVVLRESMIWTCMVVLAVAVTMATTRPSARTDLLAALAAIVTLLALGHLRRQTLLAALWALPIAVALVPAAHRVRRTLVSLAIIALVPVATGHGVAGLALVWDKAPNLGLTRTQLALDANSGFAPTSLATTSTTTTVPTTTPGTGGGTGSTSTSTSSTSTTSAAPTTTAAPGTVVDREGNVYGVEEGLGADVRHLPRGIVGTLLRPLPWESTSTIDVAFARVENIGWYALYVLALLGLVVGWRGRGRAVLAFPVVVCSFVAGIGFLTQGNVGTSFRHRAQLLWALAILAAVGVDHLFARRKAAVEPVPTPSR